MNNKDETTQRPSGLSGESALAIISVTLAALWIAFAYYNSGRTDVDNNQILLLHPLVPIALIILLIRIHRWVGIKFVVHLEVIMIGLWLFVRMLGVFMPFILGFGFAYLLRFLWRALPFKRYYQRVIATVLIVLVCSGVLVVTSIAVGRQVGQMTAGLQKFFHESILPLIGGDEMVALTVDTSGDNELFFLATNHGMYYLEEDSDAKPDEDKIKRKGITNGELLGKQIQHISVGKELIFAVAENELYQCNKPVVVFDEKTKEHKIKLPEDFEWKKIVTRFFDNQTIHAINAPSWDPTLIYVGTNKGLYESKDDWQEWTKIKLDESGDRNIVSISTIERFEDNPKDSVIHNRLNRFIYVASKITREQWNKLQLAQQSNTKVRGLLDELQNGNTGQSLTTMENGEQVNSDSEEKKNEIVTQVHSLRLTPIGEWQSINPKDDSIPDIQVLIVTDKNTYEVSTQLFAGTSEGIYEKKLIETGTWEDLPDSTRLPLSVTQIVSVNSGLYAGDASIIHHNPKRTSPWNTFITQKEGLVRYIDDPFVKQFQEYVTEKIPGWTQSGGALVRWLSGLAGSIAFQFGGFIATISLAFIVFVYASQGFNKYKRSFINLVPERHRDTALAYLREIDRNMHQFLKGQFTVILIITILSCIVYHLVGVPFALLVGILAGLCNAIPTFGPFIGGGFAFIAMLMGLAAGEFSVDLEFLIRCVFVLGAILGIQAIDNSLISPKVMSEAVDVDPLLIMFAVIVGASILGFWGVLLAIPIIVVIKSIITVSRAAENGVDSLPAQEQN